MPHTTHRSTSAVLVPAKRPGISGVLQAAVSSAPAQVSAGEVVVVVMQLWVDNNAHYPQGLGHDGRLTAQHKCK